MIDGKETNGTKYENPSSDEGISGTEKSEKSEPVSAGLKDSQSDNDIQEFLKKAESPEKLSPTKEIRNSGPEWIDAICVVTFDLDEGQLVEYMLPSGALTSQEQKLLSLLSFPDSNAFGSEGSCKYVFSLKKGKL